MGIVIFFFWVSSFFSQLLFETLFDLITVIGTLKTKQFSSLIYLVNNVVEAKASKDNNTLFSFEYTTSTLQLDVLCSCAPRNVCWIEHYGAFGFGNNLYISARYDRKISRKYTTFDVWV